MDRTVEISGTRVSTTLLVVALVGIVVGGATLGYSLGYALGYSTVSDRIAALELQLSTFQDVAYQDVTYVLGDNVSLSQLYTQVSDAIVVVHGLLVQYDFFHRAYYTEVQGSGFAYNVTGDMVIVTNHHVVDGAINITVTFRSGNGYAASLLGSDPYADLAVLATNAPWEECEPLVMLGSTTLKVGDPVIAVGNPYGLAGSMSIGVVSALGRTITEAATGGYVIANVIQTTTPLNPGNSGGPLLNYQGQVVGITTAIIEGSQGVGFAIPSNTIIRELMDLVNEGTYTAHPWLGADGIDMTYETAAALGVDLTYGWLITQVVSSGPAEDAGLRGGTHQLQVAGTWVTIGGDIVIAVDGYRITTIDALSTYLEEHTMPGQTLDVTILRSNHTLTLTVEIGTRPET